MTDGPSVDLLRAGVSGFASDVSETGDYARHLSLQRPPCLYALRDLYLLLLGRTYHYVLHAGHAVLLKSQRGSLSSTLAVLTTVYQ